MKKAKRGLALLLALVLALTMLPMTALAEDAPSEYTEETMESVEQRMREQLELEQQRELERREQEEREESASTRSMIAGDVIRATLDMTGYFPEELKAVSLQDIVDKMVVTTYGASKPDPTKIAAYTKYGHQTESGERIYENDNYVVLKGDTLDLTDYSKREYDRTFTLRLIVGAADQLNPDNQIYEITVTTSYLEDLFEFSFTDEEHNALTPISVELDDYYTNYTQYFCRFLRTDLPTNKIYTAMSFKSEYSDLTARVYEGQYQSEESIPANAKDITEQIWNPAEEGGYLTKLYSNYITVVIQRDGKTVKVSPLRIYQYPEEMDLYESSFMYIVEAGSRTEASGYGYGTYYSGYTLVEYTLKSGLKADSEYCINFRMDNPADENAANNGIQYVKKAVLGKYAKASSIPQDAEDIKEQLFSDAATTGGYKANFSKPVFFTVVDTNDKVYVIAIKAITNNTPEPVEEEVPTPLSEDTYMYVDGATKASGSGSYNCYRMPYNADSYYYNGFQTLFLLNWDGSAVSDATILPRFYKGNGVKAFVGHDGSAGTPVENDDGSVKSQNFTSGKVLPFSAAAENSVNLKNYWVTFVTQDTSGPKLFVNAANDEDHMVEKDGKKVPQREVFLTPDYGNHHDIFFANVGNAEMTGLKVELKNAQNIALDEYWTVGETKTLAPFTSTYDSDMKNIGKIRLVPTMKDGKPQTGEVKGTLVISCDGGQEVTIDLTGKAGVPTITTKNVAQGVKYVAYSSLIQTNNMYSNNVSFSLVSGKLPTGLELRPSGEIYGVPTKSGTYTFTVKAQYPETKYSGSGSDTKTFTLEILDNSNENVDATNLATAQGYTRSTDFPTDVDVSTTVDESTLCMVSEGIYSQFVKLFLDGKALQESVDYNSSEGSTQLLLALDVLKSLPNGKHTISAEFRKGGSSNGTMKRTSQNFNITGSTVTSRPSVGGGGSSTPSSYTITTAKTQHGKVTVSSSTATAGQTVTVTVAPEYGYMLGQLTVSGASTTYVRDGVYTFVMPRSNVTVSATFVERDADPETGLPFFDVHKKDWFCESVRYAYENGLMVGISKNAFAPGSLGTRSMVVAVLYRLAGEPEVTGTHPFTDVKANVYYEDAVIWATQNGIVYGTGKTTFSPNLNITREQLAAILYRYSGSPAVSGDLSEFVDGTEANDYAVDALCWAIENGVLYGKGDGRLDPLGKATRAEIAAVFQRIAEK